MDSPVIVDSASKFGRGIDLDHSFPGFPFDDDDDFGRRTDIRAHLDDLAARHPEFADHLLGPPWGDIPFRGSTHNNQRRGSGNGGSSSSYPNYPDEDARSQASGSSATSAASGASGVSSHGEPESSFSSGRSQYKESHREDRRNPIPQYGLRNTVDIGQHHRDNMENSEKDARGQRSMSAPPENRQQTNVQQSSHEQDKPQPQPGQRFVSRVDITPQHNQQSSPSQQQSSPPPPSQPTQQPQSNVRHIPIFVEGRDEPVISKNAHAPFQRQQSPPQFQNSSHFSKSSPFNLGFGSRQWRPHFQESFYQPHPSFDHSPTRRTQQSPNYQQPKQQQQYNERQRHEQQPQRHQFDSQPQEHHQSRQRVHQQQDPNLHSQQQAAGQQAQQQEASKPIPKPAPPKDPLERVALVQKEVDSLAEQVKQYTGNSRKDKQYIYLDEMLTRELIKLDDIETEGRENVRQARKNAIKTIQETISLLESKAPLPGQEQVQDDQSQIMQMEQCQEQEQESRQSNESMDVEQNNEQSTQLNEPIPLPPGPSSPKAISETSETAAAVTQNEQQNVSIENQLTKQEQEVPAVINEEQQQQEQQKQEIEIVADKSSNDNTNNITEVTMQIDSSSPMEVQEKVESVVEEKKDENQNVSHEIKLDSDEQSQWTMKNKLQIVRKRLRSTKE
ncbi:BAG domain-containing protein Samui-like isoform X2 [Vespa mandarinia]|uniref:BAG domain-containing protein Samui-like isoform X2 n=1 Tax=Vespa mandarinia TaxID=7446 RepID=UPI0016124A50|nr:BAG domain-containing protein Samui-like isoform X2 [Vespa mandarinia]XP_035733272.1 BAG domain-containing protein Samui-like isoform X2 [Vespa mandarinia]XP_035733274.1 BAG domain-containing protein Samui-like isoform X2 [Vespa mandarinia]XP_035733275.1 BAG domain-containing protein Samui-like isoform X2 [Vespa mandarinia]